MTSWGAGASWSGRPSSTQARRSGRRRTCPSPTETRTGSLAQGPWPGFGPLGLLGLLALQQLGLEDREVSRALRHFLQDAPPQPVPECVHPLSVSCFSSCLICLLFSSAAECTPYSCRATTQPLSSAPLSLSASWAACPASARTRSGSQGASCRPSAFRSRGAATTSFAITSCTTLIQKGEASFKPGNSEAGYVAVGPATSSSLMMSSPRFHCRPPPLHKDNARGRPSWICTDSCLN